VEDVVRAIVLGIVQGLTEFLPISSSGHLILVPQLLGWDDQGLAFDVGLHVGTTVALLAYFWRDWWRMGLSTLGDVAHQGTHVSGYRQDSRLLLLIALGSVPAAVVGLLFADWIEANVRQAWLVAVMLAIVGTVMLAADHFSRRVREMHSLGARDAVLIGLAQAAALIPGVSRSGATISMALFLHIKRDDAARFAFLLGTPAFVGAALLKASDLSGQSGNEWGQLVAGLVASAVVGFLVIHFLLQFLRTRTLLTFVIYRYVVAAVTLLLLAVR
jgi:undecaprenyl-diphosphatase